MKKIQNLKTLASVLFTAVVAFGCQAQNPPAKSSAPAPAPAPAAIASAQQAPAAQCPSNAVNAPKGAVKQAVTPQGQVIYIFAVWDAEPVSKTGKGKCCAATQCWQTKDGKTYCAKPLAMCPVKGNRCSGKGHMQTADKKVVCPDNNCGNAMMPCQKKWAVKEVKKCQQNGSAKCPANEHVKMKDGSKGCAPKADAKANKQIAETGGFPVLADEVVEDDTFIVTAN